jgi:hypothetical protein
MKTASTEEFPEEERISMTKDEHGYAQEEGHERKEGE